MKREEIEALADAYDAKLLCHADPGLSNIGALQAAAYSAIVAKALRSAAQNMPRADEEAIRHGVIPDPIRERVEREGGRLLAVDPDFMADAEGRN